MQNLYLGNGGTMLLRPEDIGNTTAIYLYVCLTFCLLFRNSVASTSTTSFNCCHYKYQFCIFFFVDLISFFFSSCIILDPVKSRMYRLEFDDLTRPVSGGTIVVWLLFEYISVFILILN